MIRTSETSLTSLVTLATVGILIGLGVVFVLDMVRWLVLLVHHLTAGMFHG